MALGAGMHDLQPGRVTLKLPSPITQIHNPLLNDKQIQLFIKRDELIHPVLQGNKWRKLKYNLRQASQQNKNTLLSFGGAYSNHLHALAAAGKAFNFKTIGIIRGEEHENLNPCLQDMADWGMQFKYLRRSDYRQKTDITFINRLKQEFGDFYLIPEGGNNQAGIKGCGELLDELNEDYDFICCEVGSGTTLSSLITCNKNKHTEFIGFVVMKNQQLDQAIEEILPTNKQNSSQWALNHNYHFGGFAKTSHQLDDFIKNFKLEHNIQLEPVYSGKMLFGLLDMIRHDSFKAGSKILAIHGGGLQGLRGFPQFS